MIQRYLWGGELPRERAPSRVELHDVCGNIPRRGFGFEGNRNPGAQDRAVTSAEEYAKSPPRGRCYAERTAKNHEVCEDFQKSFSL